MNFHFLYRAYHYKLRSREYSRFGLTLVKLHISRCKILNGDSSLHSEGNARCVMFLTDMPLHVSQSLPCVNTGDCSPGQHWLQFTFHNPSQLYTMLIYDYLLFGQSHQITTLLGQWSRQYWVRKYNLYWLCCCLSQIWLNLEIM